MKRKHPERTPATLPDEVLHNDQLDSAAKLIYAELTTHGDSRGWQRREIKALSAIHRIEPSYVIQCVTQLAEGGFVEFTNNGVELTIRCNSHARAVTETETSSKKKLGFKVTKETARTSAREAGLVDESFLVALDQWVEHRGALKSPFTERALELTIKRFAAWGTRIAITTIERSIENGWLGLFPSDEDARLIDKRVSADWEAARSTADKF